MLHSNELYDAYRAGGRPLSQPYNLQRILLSYFFFRTEYTCLWHLTLCLACKPNPDLTTGIVLLELTLYILSEALRVVKQLFRAEDVDILTIAGGLEVSSQHFSEIYLYDGSPDSLYHRSKMVSRPSPLTSQSDWIQPYQQSCFGLTVNDAIYSPFRTMIEEGALDKICFPSDSRRMRGMKAISCSVDTTTRTFKGTCCRISYSHRARILGASKCHPSPWQPQTHLAPHRRSSTSP
jgi:hypothetical protein